MFVPLNLSAFFFFAVRWVHYTMYIVIAKVKHGVFSGRADRRAGMRLEGLG